MSKALRNQLNPAMLIAIAALFVALGGVSYAAAKIGTKDIKNSAVTAKKLKKNAVTTVKIRTGAVTGAKIAGDAVTGAKVAESTLGKVPSAASADNAATAQKAADSDQLGGVPAAQFGSGIVGAAVSVGPALANFPSSNAGAPIGEGDFLMPVPVPVTIKHLTVRAAGDASRPFTVSVGNPKGEQIGCTGLVVCNSGDKEITLQPGELIELTATALPTPVAFTGAKYQVSYQLVP